MKSKTLGICGGKGKMAGWFIHQFKPAFKEILIYDVCSKSSLENFVSSCDLILVSVPISKTVDMISEIGQYCREDQFVMDFTSLKEAPCQALKQLRCHTLGLHPLFGPQTNHVEKFAVVFCETQKNPWVQKIQELFEAKHLLVLKMDPKAHDQKMALVQALNHSLHLMFGNVLAKHNLEQLRVLQTPSLSIFLNGLRNIIQNDGKLYQELAFENPYFLPILKEFQGSLIDYIELVQQKDEQGFTALFKKLKNQFNFKEAL